jgi:hypothetical protein
MLEALNSLPPAVYGMLGVLLGALIGSMSTLLVTYINKKAEARRNARELAVKWGIESWRTAFDAASKAKGGGFMPPIEDYVLHALIMSDVILEPGAWSEEKFLRTMDHAAETGKRIMKARKKYGVIKA